MTIRPRIKRHRSQSQRKLNVSVDSCSPFATLMPMLGLVRIALPWNVTLTSPLPLGEGMLGKADNMKKSHCPLFCKRLIALTPYSLIAFATINLFTYSPMFLFTYANRLIAVAGTVGTRREPNMEEHTVCGVGVVLVLLTRPKEEGWFRKS